MSFGSTLKRVFGIGGIEDLDDLEDLQYDPLPPAKSIEIPVVEPGDTAGELFSAVVDLFNRWQPDFVSDCLSTEAQRRYIYDSLSAELRQRIDTPAAATSISDEERRDLLREIDRLKYEASKTEEIKNKLEQTRLSAERQKRALSDRVVDLTRQVASLEQTNEKLALAGATHVAEADTTGEIERLKAEIEKLTAEVERLTTLNQQLDTKARMSDTMLSEMKSKCTESKKEAQELSRQLDEFSKIVGDLDKVEEVINRKDATIAAQTAKIKAMEEERRTLRKTIETNLYNQAHNENRLRKRVKELEARLGIDSEEPRAGKEGKRSRRRRGNDAPSGSAAPETDDGDFGYKAPVRPKHRDDESQMSLF